MPRALSVNYDIKALELLAIFGQLFTRCCFFESHAFQTFKQLPVLKLMPLKQHTWLKCLKDDAEVLLVFLFFAFR